MTNVREKTKKLHWKKWLHRKFSAFITSFFIDGLKKESFEKIGLKDITAKAYLFQDWYWYECPEIWEDAVKKVDAYLKHNSIFDITNNLDVFYKKNKEMIKILAKENGDPVEQFKIVYDIMAQCVAFIWAAHGIEEYYRLRLKKEVPKYIKGDIDKFIGDASFPKKKNSLSLMEEAILKGEDPKEIAREFGWIRPRYEFERPFNEKDILRLGKELKPKERKEVKIPKQLERLFNEVQELVYFRTARTDVFYELLFLARPILKRLAKFYKIPFADLQFYSAKNLIDGTPKRYNKEISFAFYEEDYYFGDDPILEEEVISEKNSLKGAVAFKGIVRGKARIVRGVSDIAKVCKGDILVTQMTFPSFISAMHKASAFVTDEGGITCHAAIVAREMRKPCITGTKHATKMFKDGDYIEVDANKGIVRKVRI